MTLTAAELKAVYSVDEGPLDRSLSGLGGKVSGTLGKVAGAAAGLFAFDKIKDGFLDVTGAASDLNETVSKSNTIFGANAAEMDSWSQGAAKNLGLSRERALAAAAGFGDMFSQIGFAGGEASNMSRKVVQMSADLGSFNNLETADVADRMSAAFRGEYDSLQALIPNINGARVEQEAMAATGKKNAKELTAQEKAAAVLAIVQKDGAKAMGDFAKTSEGAANASKIAAAEWEDQKAKIGQGLLPIYQALVAFISGTLVPAIGTAFEFIRQVATAFVNAWKYNDGEVTSSGIPGFFERLGYIARQVFDFIRGAITAFTSAWKYNDGEVTSSGFNGYMEMLGYVARQAADVLTGVVIPAIASFAGFLIEHQGTIKVIAALIAAVFIPHLIALAAQATLTKVTTGAMWLASKVGAIQAAVVHSAQIVAMIAKWVALGVAAVAQGVVIAAVWTAQIVASAVTGAASFAVQVARVVAGWVLMGVQAMLQAARMAAAWFIALGPIGWVAAAIIGLVALVIANWDTVVAWTKAAWGFAVDAVKAAVDFLVFMFMNFTGVGLIIKHWDTLVAATQAAFDWVKGVVRAGLDLLVSWFMNFTGVGVIIKHWQSIVDFTRSAWSAVTGAVSGAWRSVVGAVSGGVSDAVSWVAGLPGRVLGALGNMGSLLYEKGRDLIQGLLNGAGSLLSKIGSFFLDKVPGWIKGPFKSALGINSPSLVFAGYGENIGEGLVNGLAGMRPAVAAEMLRMADTGALGSLTAPTIGVRTPALAGAGSVVGGSGAGAAGGIGTLVHIDTYQEAPGSSAQSTAQALVIEARTRGLG